MSKPDKNQTGIAVWQTGFRPFFLGAATWSIISMMIWFGLLNLNWQFSMSGLAGVHWHAHEMIYGYTIAVVAGFLLTAVPKWTSSAPVCGSKLMVVFIAWLVARVTGLFGSDNLLLLSAVADMVFIFGLLVLIAIPIIKQRQLKQIGILVKVAILGLGNLAFYLGAANVLENGMFLGLYTGLYLIIALILTLGRRVIPFFIESRLRLENPLNNRKWVEIGSLLLFLVFWIGEVFSQRPQIGAVAAIFLCVLHSVRLFDWYRPGIWSDPLLWVLYVSYLFIVIAFGIKGASLAGFTYSPLLTLHLFAIGGIGLISCGMMTRVSLAHTGRDIRSVPALVTVSFLCIALSAICRVFLPMVNMEKYLLWVSISQLLWIIGFTIFLLIFFSTLLRPRIDGTPG